MGAKTMAAFADKIDQQSTFIMQITTKKSKNLPFALAALLAASISGCSQESQNNIEGQIPCPGAQYSAVIYHRNADKILSETENVSIIRYGQPVPNEIGNVYSASREQTGAPQKLWLNWRTPDSLQIFRNPKTHAYREDKHFDCLTGIFIQTTPFTIEYGNYDDVKSGPKTEEKPRSRPTAKPVKKHAQPRRKKS